MKYLKLFFVIVIILFSKSSISQEYNSDEMPKTTILSFLESEEKKAN
jgi:hypothetical protein